MVILVPSMIVSSVLVPSLIVMIVVSIFGILIVTLVKGPAMSEIPPMQHAAAINEYGNEGSN